MSKLTNTWNIEKFNTPAFIYNEKNILQSLNNVDQIRSNSGCKILFPVKAFSIYDGLILISSIIDGFSTSSLFEAQLAKDILGSNGQIHVITPAYKPDEIESIAQLADYITFNSLTQWERYFVHVSEHASCGLRVNPQLSYVKDDRYNPCRKQSKLGVPLKQLIKALEAESRLYYEIEGIHFHTNSRSESYSPLLETVQHLDKYLSPLLLRIKWINLGGGYLINEAERMDDLCKAIELLKRKYDLDVFIEPGLGVVEEAGYIVSSVIDIFESEGQNIAILDTTVNHMPEVFEYQYKPDVMQESPNGRYEYILAGSTCLAGDIFGTYTFAQPLEIGTRIVFEYMGAYTLVKAHMFNGVNLPSIYALTRDNRLELKKQFGYDDYLSRCGVTKRVPV